MGSPSFRDQVGGNGGGIKHAIVSTCMSYEILNANNNCPVTQKLWNTEQSNDEQYPRFVKSSYKILCVN